MEKKALIYNFVLYFSLIVIFISLAYQNKFIVYIFFLIALFSCYKIGYFNNFIESFNKKENYLLGNIDTEEIKELVKLAQDIKLKKNMDIKEIESKFFDLITEKHYFIERNEVIGQDIVSMVLNRKIMFEIANVEEDVSYELLKNRLKRFTPRFTKIFVVMINNEKAKEYSSNLLELDKAKIIIVLKEAKLKKKDNEYKDFTGTKILGARS